MHKGDIAAAKTVLADVVNNGTTSSGAAYGLEDDLDNNFNALTENGKEAIFSVQYSAADENTGGAPFCLNYPHTLELRWMLWFLSTFFRISELFPSGRARFTLFEW